MIGVITAFCWASSRCATNASVRSRTSAITSWSRAATRKHHTDLAERLPRLLHTDREVLHHHRRVGLRDRDPQRVLALLEGLLGLDDDLGLLVRALEADVGAQLLALVDPPAQRRLLRRARAAGAAGDRQLLARPAGLAAEL